MRCMRLREIGLIVLLDCALSAAAAEPPGAAASGEKGLAGNGQHERAATVKAATTVALTRDQAWGHLRSEPPESDPAALSRAILTIVRAGFPEDLDRLASYMESHRFAQAFAIPPEFRFPRWGSCSFMELLRMIAECDTTFAEELLVLYAHSDFISQDEPRDRDHWFRRDYMLQALGILHPKTNGTYSFLCKEWMSMKVQDNRMDPYRVIMEHGGDGEAFLALVSIGDEQATGILRREMFRDPRDWSRARNLDLWLSDIAVRRDKPANFELLLSLATEAPGLQLQERILPYLVERQLKRGSEGRVYEYPSYDRLPDATRDKMLKVVNAAEASKFSPKAIELVDRLKAMLSN